MTKRRFLVCGVLLLWGGLILCLCVMPTTIRGANSLAGRRQADDANEAHAQTPPAEKTAEQAYKNIQVLKHVPASQMVMVMNYMRASLGVRCDYCHTLERNQGLKGWEKDDKVAKQTARKHMQMVFDINRQFYGGQTVVTCNTCHQGQPRPVSVPPIGQAAFKDQVITNPNSLAPSEPLPPVDQILDRYVQAVGGKAAIEKLKTRVWKGSFVDWDGTTLPLEVYQAAPNKFASIITQQNRGAAFQLFDGTQGWARDFRGQQRAVNGAELALLKRNSELQIEIRLKELYPSLKVAGKEKVNHREAFVVEATSAEGRSEKYFFDAQTGLLLRRYVELPMALGANPEQTDYEDYKDVEGLKVPFTITMTYLDTHVASTRKFTEIKSNVPVEDSRFAPPATQK